MNMMNTVSTVCVVSVTSPRVIIFMPLTVLYIYTYVSG